MIRSALVTAFAAASLFATGASATTIVAAQNGGCPTCSNFTIVYNDLNGDHLLEINEVTSFSGLTVGSNFYSQMPIDVPNVPNIAQWSNLDPVHLGTCGTYHWCFSYQLVPVSIFDYTVDGIPTPVPEPSIWALTTLGLATLFATRRSRKV